MTEPPTCPFCESEITTTAKKCRHCGEWVSRNCLSCGTPIRDQWAARGYCADCESVNRTRLSVLPAQDTPTPPLYHTPKKSRSISVGLALVLGGIGAHKFYLGKPGKGLLYMLFCWTGIPTLVGLYEAAKYIWMDEAEFHQRYARGDL